MTDTDKPASRTGVIILKPLEAPGVRLETRTVNVTFPFSDTVSEIKIAGQPYNSLFEALLYTNSLGLATMDSRSVPGREGGVLQLMDTKAQLRSDYLISSVRSIEGEVAFEGHNYWVIEDPDESVRAHLFRPILR